MLFLLAKEKILILTEKISKNISCIRLSSIVINDNDILQATKLIYQSQNMELKFKTLL